MNLFFYIKKRCRILLIIAFSMTGIQSCKKYLDEKSDKKLVTLQTVKDFQAVLDDASFMNVRHSPSMGESAADDYFWPVDIYEQQDDFLQKMYIWNMPAYNNSNEWTGIYKPVYNSNLCLEGIENVERTSSNATAWDNVKGSALFYRGYSFFNVASVYAKAFDEATADTDLGIPLRMGSDFNVPSVRGTVRQTYQQILSDAKEAAVYLPLLPEATTRPSRCAAFGLLARVYLAMGKFDSAYHYADKALAIKNNLHDYNSTAGLFVRYNDETIFYDEMNTEYMLFSPSYAKIDTNLIASYEPNDKRRQLLFSGTGYVKFVGTYTASRTIFFSGLATDELYFIKAEAAARLGNTGSALATLNAVLEKRWATGTFVPFAAATSAEATTMVVNERRKSLLMRGLRWMDIKRLNKLGYNITPTRMINNIPVKLPPNDKRYALPLPADIVSISGMQQN